MNRNRLVFNANAPRIAELCPVIGVFLLEAVLNCLPEKTIFITYAVTFQQEFHSSRAVKETSRKPSQTAVSESRVLNFLKIRQATAHAVQKFFGIVVQSQTQNVIVNRAPHKKFHRKI